MGEKEQHSGNEESPEENTEKDTGTVNHTFDKEIKVKYTYTSKKKTGSGDKG